MFKHLLLWTLTAQAVWAKPVQPLGGDLASHIVIVTPQAQVHLDPALKYDASTTFIHHLSPLARFVAPHDETIVYVPASAAGPITHAISEQQPQSGAETKLKQIEQIQTAIQNAASMYGPQLSEAGAAAAAAASSVGTGFFPALFPPPNSNKEEQQLKGHQIDYDTPANTQPLIVAEGRRFYSISPAVPHHVVDFVHGPVFVGAIRARSLQQTVDLPIVNVPLPEVTKPEALPLKIALKEESKESASLDQEKKTDFGRFLEANASKEESKPEKLDEIYKKEDLKAEPELGAQTLPAAIPIGDQDLSAALLKSAPVEAVAPVVGAEVPQSKVA